MLRWIDRVLQPMIPAFLGRPAHHRVGRRLWHAGLARRAERAAAAAAVALCSALRRSWSRWRSPPSGLLASTLHLGHPERAWRSVSQWRTSWLSREGVMALLTYLPAVGFAAAWWFAGAESRRGGRCWGLLAAAVRAGNGGLPGDDLLHAAADPAVAPPPGDAGLLLLALFTGAVWLAAAVALDGAGAARLVAAIAVVFAAGGGAVKLAYWRQIDAASAGRNDRERDRAWARSARCACWNRRTPRRTICCARWAMPSPASMPRGCARSPWRSASSRRSCCCWWAPLLAGPAGIAAAGRWPRSPPLLGIYVERWLFFAQATHTVTLYYGRRT